MTTTTSTSAAPLSTVIGVFPTQEQADGAIDALRQTNFRYDHIRVVERGTGGFGDTLKGMFTGQASVASSTADSLVKMGLPDYEAQYYQNELDANHVLVLMNADDRPEEALSVMRQNGAFDIQLRLRMPVADGSTRSASQATPTTTQPQTSVPTAPQAVAPNGTNANTSVNDGAPLAYDPAAVPPAVTPSSDPDMADQRADREAPQNV